MTEYFTSVSITVTYVIPMEGEPFVNIAEDGEADVVTKLGMLELARDSLLHPEPHDSEEGR